MAHTIIMYAMIGISFGFLAGLGIGGGSLLVIWLTLVCGMGPETARMINLMFFLPTALLSCPFRWHQGTIPWKTVLPAAGCGCLSAALFAWISSNVQAGFLRPLFGILLIAVGLKELLYRERKAR